MIGAIFISFESCLRHMAFRKKLSFIDMG